MAEKVLVIVESPTKARTISKFLPKNFIVEASIGHIRDLPQTAADVPAKYKPLPWARLGIDVENNFTPLYITPKGKSKVINELKRKLKDVTALYLATDEDREGESISWHLVELLKPKQPIKRMVFHEITKKAIQEALESPRDIDMNLVRAQETRRILDRLYGFTLSPLIWKKIAYGLSAGRVQSSGLRMIVDRERERLIFKKSIYWDLKALLTAPETGSDIQFEAKLLQVGDKRVAQGKDFDPLTGSLLGSKDVVVLDEASARKLETDLAKRPWKVMDITEKETFSRPSAPFITSTLQQEGNRKLGLTSRETMRIAQRLYEEGLITYMRTDSPTLSSEAIAGARKTIEETFGAQYLSAEARQFNAKSKGAQEAHEAIRPSGSQFTHPDETSLTGKDKALYELIWKRTLATQMADAKKSSVAAKIQCGDGMFQANGTKILFPGFLRVYVEGKDDPDAALEDKEVILPDLKAGTTCEAKKLESLYHETKPPARYTEASLIQRLEKEGIGRPSTYASIISTLYERNYVRKQGTSLVPTFTGIAVVQFLEKNFDYLVQYGFTSEMENQLDQIAEGKQDRLEYLKEFYLGDGGLVHQVEEREGKIKPEESRTIHLPQLEEDTEIKVGRFGPYIVHQDKEHPEPVHVSIPEEIAPGDLTKDGILELIELQKNGPKPIGMHPDHNQPIYCLVGRFGPYVQLGEATEENPKPRRAGVPREISPKDVTIELAVQLLSLPRVLGVHPETGKEVSANVGRFGPFVVHDGDFRSLKKDDDVYTVDLDRALEILNEPKTGGRGSKLLKDFGKGSGGKKVGLYEGKYGPYLKVGTKNVGIPEDKRTPEFIDAMTLAQAEEIIKASKR
jgi:DNA topoisomerase-1